MPSPMSDPKAPPRGSVALLSVTLLAASLWMLHEQLQSQTWPEVWAVLAAVPPGAVLMALLATLLNYGVLTGYDLLSVRYAEVQLSYRRVALASTLGFALSPVLGFPLLTGAPSRLRLYGRWGVGGEDIARIVVCSSLTFWLGALSIVGVRLTLGSSLAGGSLPLALRAVGALMLVACGVYLVLTLIRRSPERLRSLPFALPSPLLATAQVLVGVTEWLIAASALYVLVPTPLTISFPTLLGAFVVARLVGLVSFVPGGLGVFEAVFVALMPPGIPTGALFASLIAYRVVYFLVPLVIAAVGLAAAELHERRHRAARLGSAVASVLPTTLAALVFVLGATLLLFESTPLSPGRLAHLAQ